MERFRWKTVFFEFVLGSLVTAGVTILVRNRKALGCNFEKALSDNMAPGKGFEHWFTGKGCTIVLTLIITFLNFEANHLRIG